MGPLQRRRAIREAAREAGLGEVVRIHRSYSRALAVGLWALVVVSFVVAVIMTIIQVYEGSTTWQWPLLGWSLLVGLALVLPQVGPMFGGRHWVGVARGGLVFWERDSVWTATWADAPRLEESSLCGVRDVEDSRLRRAPVGAWTSRRVGGLGAIAVFAVVATLFTAVPIVRNYVIGDQPAKVDQLQRLCQGGRAFGQSASYDSEAPHPVVAFGDGTQLYSSDPRVEPASVELVACVDAIGGQLVKRCEYQSSYTRTLYDGQFRVRVFEARTGRLLGSLTTEGSKFNGNCAPMIWTPDDEKSEDVFNYPDEEILRSRLAPFVG
ncbi:hypothetical protein [Kutzneria sp. NPDC052558]|uniref:hypothetical protein n=1 Tax=Kutzneria sp. NPDC052558 TaxID=3364121 RepID=UPI0037CC69DC